MKSDSTLFKTLYEAELIIFEQSAASRTVACKDLLDPDDPELQAILGADIQALPPPPYRTRPILATMRRLGLLSLLSGEGRGFILAAKEVATRGNVPGAFLLLEHLRDNHKLRQLWPVRIFEEIGAIAFFPAANLMSESYPPPGSLHPPQHINFSLKMAQKVTQKGSTKAQHDMSTRGLLQRAYEETSTADDGILPEPDMGEVFARARGLLRRHQEQSGEQPALQLVALGSATVLNEFGWIGWRTSDVLAPVVTELGPPLLRKLGLVYPPPIRRTVDHLKQCIRSWRLTPADKAQLRVQQGVVLLCLAYVQLHLACYPAQDLGLAQVAVPYDDGSWVQLNAIVPELQGDLSTDHRAPAPYLSELSDLLDYLCSSVVSDSDTRLSRPANTSNKHTIADGIAGVFDQELCSDVLLLHPEGTLHLHKVVLALTSPFFRTMFSAGMQESRGPVTLEAPAWAQWPALRMLFQYHYTGQTPRLQVNQETVDLVLNLLRVADFYACPFLKDHCQWFLAEHGVSTMANTIELLALAVLCDARALTQHCSAIIRKNLGVAMKFPNWALLPPEVQASLSQTRTPRIGTRTKVKV